MSKVICITGASSGIGKSIGEFFVKKGYRVFGSSRNPEKYPNSNFPLFQLDVRDTNSVVQFIEKVTLDAKPKFGFGN